MIEPGQSVQPRFTMPPAAAHDVIPTVDAPRRAAASRSERSPLVPPIEARRERAARATGAVSVLCCLLLAALPATTSANVTREASASARGFDAKSAHAVAEIDSVNLFTGALNVSIPIGEPISAGPALKLQLHLIYNSNAWEFLQGTGYPEPVSPETPVDSMTGVFAYPAPDLNAGLGWKVSVGELVPPGAAIVGDVLLEPRTANSHFWTFIGPDGAKHEFFSTLHAGTDTPAMSISDADVQYSRDGTYLRMRKVSSSVRVVELPDGTIFQFACGAVPDGFADYWYSETDPKRDRCWHLERVYDLRGGNDDTGLPRNRIDFTYRSEGGNRYVRSLSVRRDDDSLHTVNLRFQRNPALDGQGSVRPVFRDAAGWITAIEFPALSSYDAPQGQGLAHTPTTAMYTFDYGPSFNPLTLPDMPRGCHPNLNTLYRLEGFLDGVAHPILPTTTRIPRLHRLVLPDGSSYGDFTYLGTTGGSELCDRSSTMLTSLRYPSGAKVEWLYHDSQQPESFCPTPRPDSGDIEIPSARPVITRGVLRRTVRSTDNAVLSDHAYLRGATGERLMKDGSTVIRPADICDVVYRQATTTVLDERGLATVNYFNTFNEVDVWFGTASDIVASSVEDGWRSDEYGQNFTRYHWRNPDGTAYAFDPEHPTTPLPPARDRLYLRSETYDCRGSLSIAGMVDAVLHPVGTTQPPSFIDGAAMGVRDNGHWRRDNADFYSPLRGHCGQRLRATYVTQQTDLVDMPVIVPGTSPTAGTVQCALAANVAFDCGNTNPRTVATLATVRESDTVEQTAGTRYSGFTGMGQFTTSQTFGSWVSNGDVIRHDTTFRLSEPPPASARWRLNDVIETVKTEGPAPLGNSPQKVRTLYWVDALTGFVQAERKVRRLDGAPADNDVFIRYGATPEGHVDTERTYGGDLQAGNWPSNTANALPSLSSPAYQKQYLYVNDVVSEVRSTRPTPAPAGNAPGAAGALLLIHQRNDVDPHTGKVTRTQDAAGVGVEYGYDVMGRLTIARTDSQFQTSYTYCVRTQQPRPAQCLAAAPNAVYMVERSLAGNSVLAENGHFYDDGGRLTETQSEYMDGRAALPASVKRNRLCTRYGLAGQIDYQMLVSSLPDAAVPFVADCPHPVSGTWPENSTTRFTYDVEGRVRSVRAPDGNETTTTYTGDRVVTTQEKVRTPADPASGPFSTTKRTHSYDYLKRLVATKEPAAEASGANAICTSVDACMVSSAFVYDVNQNLVVAEVNKTDPPSADTQVRQYGYDALGWALSAKVPELIADGEQVVQHFRAFDALGKPTELQASNRIVRHQLDALGREIATRVNGTLLAETFYADRNCATHYTSGCVDTATEFYDRKAGKPVLVKRHNRNAPGNRDIVVSERYQYRSPAGARSHTLLSVAELGAVAGAAGTVHARSDLVFTSASTYDVQGNLVSHQYPSCVADSCASAALPPRTARYAYGRGTLTGVTDDTPPATQRTLLEIGYHENDAPAQFEHHLPSGQTMYERQDLDTSQRLGAIRVTNPAGATLFGITSIRYDGTGKITSIQRSGAGTADEFAYDLAGRLVLGSVTPPGAQKQTQFAQYDRFGNLTELSGPAGTSVLLDVDRESNRLRSERYGATQSPVGYDHFGNVIQWRSQLLDYDGFNMPNLVFREAGSQALVRGFAYAPGNERVLIEDENGDQTLVLRGGTTKVLRELSRKRNGTLSWKRDTLHAGARQFAVIGAAPAAENRYFVDHLGSTRLVTDASGSPVSEFDYLPFGEYAREQHFAAGSETGTLRFASHERDRLGAAGTDEDLDYMHARYYAPRLGRFLSLDAYLGDVTSPLSLNRYAYVRNSPVSSIDPDGNADHEITIRLPSLRLLKVWTDGQRLEENMKNIQTWIAAKTQKLFHAEKPEARPSNSRRSYEKARGAPLPRDRHVDHRNGGLIAGAGNKLDDLQDLDASVNPSHGARLKNGLKSVPKGGRVGNVKFRVLGPALGLALALPQIASAETPDEARKAVACAVLPEVAVVWDYVENNRGIPIAPPGSPLFGASMSAAWRAHGGDATVQSYRQTDADKRDN